MLGSVPKHAADLRLVPRLLRADRHQSHVHLRRLRPRPDDQGLLPDPRAVGRHHPPLHPGRRRRRLAAGLQARLDAPHHRRLHLVLPQHAAAGADLFLLFRARLPAAPRARRLGRPDPDGLQRRSGRSSRCRCSPAPSTSRSSAPASRPFRSRRWRRPTSFGLSRWQIYRLVVLPMAIRVCLPALGNNLVNLVKTTNLAYAIAVPELLYVSKQIWSDATNVREMMFFVLFAYLCLGVRAGRRPQRHRAAPRHPRLRPAGRPLTCSATATPSRCRQCSLRALPLPLCRRHRLRHKEGEDGTPRA